MKEQPTTVSYFAFGDSLTQGVGAARPDQHWVSQYFSHLRCSDQCTLRNFGVSGMTSSELFTLINIPSIARLIPNATHISISTGGCDFIQLYESGSITLKILFQTIRKVHSQVDQILAFIRSHAPQAIVHLLGFYIPVPAYELGEKQASWFVQSLNKNYEKVCRQYQARLVNPFDRFYRRFDYFYDEVHPNQAGHDEIAKLFIH
ncbi:Lysophospholipase L1 [Thermoflavimicrobium dichotomicum]|uniref:Lysophospholipase L1 n=2 Tax=Thermoflavimicrobium dichotomicum TaxID=46223 RepID=A0A1I3U7S2_9BACL|nr:Lysophospholipase L1 [Thermoflavimicrobium dichotomicum]